SLPQVELNPDLELAGKDGLGLFSSRLTARRPASASDNDPNILDSNQWKLIHDTGARTCAGGNWIRKFADGTNDWSRQRLKLDVSNFKCLNYRTPLLLTEEPSAYFFTEEDAEADTILKQDLINFCVDSGLSAAGCAQFVSSFDGNGDGIGQIEDFITKTPPSLNKTVTRMKIDSDPEVMNDNDLWSQNRWAFMQFLSYDEHPDPPYLNWTMSHDDLENSDFQAAKQIIVTRMPSFIPFKEIEHIRIDMENPKKGKNGEGLHDPAGSCKRLTPASYTCSDANAWYGLCESTNVSWNDPGGHCDDSCCYMYDDSTRMLKVAYPQDVIDSESSYGEKAHSLIVEFTAPGTLRWEQTHTPALAGGDEIDDPDYLPHRRSSKPGNALYYLEKLARLEYIGIPQMTYEPIFCNDIYLKLAPGIFKENIKVASDFINNPNTFIADKTGKQPYWEVPLGTPAANDPEEHWDPDTDLKKVADQELLAHEPIFSDHDFKCCLPLGASLDENQDPSICCSGVGSDPNLTNNSTVRKCALPNGANLNVYFNKFVSGEGLSSKYLKNAAPLTVEDFNEETGEPKTNATVVSKLTALGNELCAGRATARGGVLGPFDGEPFGTLAPADSDPAQIYSFVDSPFDISSINDRNVGYDMFKEGYRWNHHVYCAPGRN
ncbi:MAG: hypothetical protein WEB87_03825, partial [Bacteriovoracaceae bacterium]